MSNMPFRIPSYRRHKSSGQAVVTIAGRDIYLGKFNTPASRSEYNRIIAEWTAHSGLLPQQQANDLTVVELLASFMRHAKRYYRRLDGTATNEVKNLMLVVRRLNEHYARTRAIDFGPIALQAVREKMIESGLARHTINKDVGRIRLIFKWATANELVNPGVLQRLQAVAGLRAGRSKAKETAPIKPVPDIFVDAVLSYVSPQVGAMIELQRLTGMRSGEVTTMRAVDIDMRGRVWIFSPEHHKTAWHGHHRQIYLGPRAQQIVRLFLKTDLQAFLFSPVDAEAARNQQRFGVCSQNRKTKVFPSELRSRKKRRVDRARKSRRRLGPKYDTISYYQAIQYGIKAANKARLAEAKANAIDPDKVELVPHWHPHQLRHNAATALRREHGIEVARIILGHRSAAITEVYAEADHTRAIDVMAKIG